MAELLGISQNSSGFLGRLEAAGMSALIDACLSSGVTVVADLKCALGNPEPTPEKAATEAILRRVHHLFWVGVGSDLGVSRLVRDWTLLEEMTQDVHQSVLLRVTESSSELSLEESSNAVWGFTGCSDIKGFRCRRACPILLSSLVCCRQREGLFLSLYLPRSRLGKDCGDLLQSS